jgi:uncharacterized protein YqeY
VSEGRSGLKDQLRTDLTAAMRERDEVTVAALRLALAAVSKAEVAGDEAATLDDEAIVAILRSETKKRAEAAEIYDQGGRGELAGRERAQAAVLERYLPAEMDDAALATIVAEEVDAARAAGVDERAAMGQVIKAVRARVGADAGGGRVAAAVKAALGQG